MELQRGEEGQRHLRFIKIQSPLIAYSRNQTVPVVITHCNDLTALTREHFWFLIGAFA